MSITCFSEQANYTNKTKWYKDGHNITYTKNQVNFVYIGI
jgi:hypothetical protein